MAKIGLPKGSGKRLIVREKSVKSQGILKWILSGNPVNCLFKLAQESVVRRTNLLTMTMAVDLGCKATKQTYSQYQEVFFFFFFFPIPAKN